MWSPAAGGGSATGRSHLPVVITPVGELPSVQGARHLRARTGGEGLAGHPVTHTCWRTAISTGARHLRARTGGEDLQDIWSHTPVGELPSVQGARHLRARTGGEGLAGHPVTHTCWRTAISTGRASLESEDRWRRTCRTSSHTHLLENCHQYRRASLESEDRWRGLAGHLVTHTCWRTAISTGRASLESEDRWRRTCRTSSHTHLLENCHQYRARVT